MKLVMKKLTLCVALLITLPLCHAADAPNPVPESVRKMREKSARDAEADRIAGDDGAERKARECIAFWQQQVTDQKAIAKEVGYVDKNVMYQAGLNLVSCKRQLKQIQGSKAKAPSSL